MMGLLPSCRNILLTLCLSACTVVSGQEASTQVRISFQNTSLDEALRDLSSATGVRIVYSPDMIPASTIDRTYEGSLEEVLVALLLNTGLSYRKDGDQYVVFRSEPDLTPFTVSGYVEDEDSGERLIGAHVYDLNSGAGAITNAYGFFSFQARGAGAALRVSYLGYQQDTIISTRTMAGGTQKIQLTQLLVIREVVIEDSEDRYMSVHPLTSHHFNRRELSSKVSLGGELDVQRFMENLPGVSIGVDGIGGLHVRGGNGDQNLILFDGVALYHSTHAVGILSVFNPLMIRDVRLEKGEFPARYAGRLSSVLDVRTKEGNNKMWSVQSTLGLATVNALVEGPIVKDKVGVLVAARKFLPGFYLRNLSSREKADNGLSGETQYSFTDLNAKCNISLTERDRLYLSFYHGDDSYEDFTRRRTIQGQNVLTEQFQRTLNWGNSVGILRWNHHFGKNLFMNATATLSRFELITDDSTSFNQRLPDETEIEGFIARKFESSIKDAGLRFDFDHFISNKHRLRYGFVYTRHTLSPKSIVFDDEALVNGFPVNEPELDELLASLEDITHESGIYLEDEFSVSEALNLSGGVHLARFDVRDTTFWSVQPRLGLSLRIVPGLYSHVSAGVMTQYLHLLTSSGIGFPTDLWVPATPSVRPQSASQLSAGLTWTPHKHLSFKADVYTRRLNHLIAYQEGASFLFREGSVPSGIVDAANWENKVTQGSGKSYGIEFVGNLTGNVADFEVTYTLAHSTRQFDDLNAGKAFPFRFDRRHALSASCAVYFNKHLAVYAGWNYASGIPITLAESRILHPSSGQLFPAIQFAPVQVIGIGEKNAYRLPDYHRLDIGAKYLWRRPKAEHSIQLDFYNVYNRDNILYLTLIQEENGFKNQQFTVLPFIPSLSYHLKI